MSQLEQGMSGLTELVDRYAKEIRAVSEEVLNAVQKPSSDDLRRKVTEVQDRIYQEALEKYDHVERELEARLDQIKAMKERAVLLKEIISWTVGHGKTATPDVTVELLRERLKRESH